VSVIIGCVLYLYLIFIFYNFVKKIFSFFSGQLLMVLSLSVRLTLYCVTFIFILFTIYFKQ